MRKINTTLFFIYIIQYITFMKYRILALVLMPCIVFLSGINCTKHINDSSSILAIASILPDIKRQDLAYKIDLDLTGSLQNPAWSPDGTELLLTHFSGGYNKGPADLLIYSFSTNSTRTLVSDGNDNINLPGSSWNQVLDSIVFSSSREPHDEIYIIYSEGFTGDETKITSRDTDTAYEPSLSPDGQWIVFESHPLDVENSGRIVKYKLDGSQGYSFLTDAGSDCRQPNWSPMGDVILYQKYSNLQWDIWVMNTDGTGKKKITSGSGNKTDASFTPDGQWIVFSYEPIFENANIYKVNITDTGSQIRITSYQGYDGAPSVSPDGKKIAFESCQGDPDTSRTYIWIIDVE